MSLEIVFQKNRDKAEKRSKQIVEQFERVKELTTRGVPVIIAVQKAGMSRNTFYHRLKRFNIDPSSFRRPQNFETKNANYCPYCGSPDLERKKDTSNYYCQKCGAAFNIWFKGRHY